MQLRVSADALKDVRAGAVAVPIFADGRLDGAAAEADAAVGGALADAVSSGEAKGKLCEVTLIHAKDRSFRRLLAVGLGERSAFEPHLLARYTGTAVRVLGRKGVAEIAIAFPDEAARDPRACVAAAAEGALTGTFEITLYQAKPEERVEVATVSILLGKLDAERAEEGLRRGSAIGDAVNLARRLAVTPANDMTPTILADEATKAATESGIQIDVHDADWARKQGMGSFLSVASGSAQPPKFIVMTYKGDPSSKELLALVGKGITFDTGGTSIKPAEKMEDMKYDMSGGAGVIAAMHALGTLKPRINVVGIVPATENMPGGRATKPGDVVRAMNGKSIEIINTDAEGRLILADALCYANKLGATRICDAATLTGAVTVALGGAFAAILSNDDSFCNEFLAAAKPTGERYWRLPLDAEYLKAMKSDIADLKNTGGRAAGTCTASAFLEEFVGDTPWIHLDIAATAYTDKTSAWSAKGPTGVPVRSFVALAEALSG
jgi:leucyl aminopeptidase